MIKVLEAFDAAQKPVVVEQQPDQRPMGMVTPPEPIVKNKGGRPRKVAEPVEEPQEVVEVKPNGGLKVVPKEEPAPETKPEIEMADVRNALTRFLSANNEAAATALLKTHGHTDRLSKLERQYFEAVYVAAMTPTVKTPGMFDDDVSDVGV
jgi:hypothetical protein